MSSAARRRAARSLVSISSSVVVMAALVASTAGAGAAPATLRSRTAAGRIAERPLVTGEEGDGERGDELLEALEQYAAAKTAPAESVPGAAYQAALVRAGSMPVVGGTWDEVTDVPYQTESAQYADPIFSNAGSGNGLAGGRVQALAIDGRTIYAGAADGGVWRSTDGGDSWTPLTDGLPTTASGAIAVDPRTHDVWYGTGEASTAFDNYLGSGIYRSTDYGDTWRRIGGRQLDGTLVSAVAFDGNGHVLASTSNGVYERSSSDPPHARWTLVLSPGKAEPYGFRFANDVQVRPGTDGREVVATLGWRSGPTDYQGFYVSHRGGAKGTWHRVHTRGRLRSSRIARASLAYSADGTRLYALVESWQNLNSTPSGLEGIFESRTGDIGGPWSKKAGWRTLQQSHSGLKVYGTSYAPGVQAWYNQFIGVDPRDRDHVYVGLEEVYESTTGGDRWLTVGPYFNFGLPCFAQGSCRNTTHPDQHAIAFANGQVWVGNDGGVYSRSTRDHLQGGWKNHNADLHALQYYYAGISQTADGDAYWGGLQDNGVSYLPAGADRMVSPFGGDGGDIIVDPADPERAVVEYTDLDMALTTNAGRSDGTTVAWTEMTPSCFAFTYTPDPCDPNPRFIAPFRADPEAPDTHWVAGGEFVWETNKGWNTQCADTHCDWKAIHDTGEGNAITALAVDGSVVYAGWCGGASVCNPGAFESGIDTNYGGTWHRVDGRGVPNGGDRLPNRYVTALTVDPADPAHVYAVFGAYSRRWIPGGGVGHVFESTDGGATWTDISGNLPDVPGADLVLAGSRLIVSMDVGVFVADAADPTSWSRLGSGLPHAAANDLTLAPDGSFIVAVTHGRGLWRLATP
jgi:hypothetical protein